MKTGYEGGRRSGAGRAALLAAALCMIGASAPAQTVAIASLPSRESRSLAHKLFGRMEWTDAESAFRTPREICRMVQKHVRYVNERTDQWAAPQKTWDAGRGDCEDFAVLIQELCRLQGISTKVHLYFPANGQREGHAVLVGEWQGRIWFSSNGSYEELRSEQDVRRRVARMLSCRETQLWAMKMTEADVAKFIGRAPAGTVATASL